MPPGSYFGNPSNPKTTCFDSPCQLALTDGVQYSVYVSATNAAGKGPPSLPYTPAITATPAVGMGKDWQWQPVCMPFKAHAVMP